MLSFGEDDDTKMVRVIHEIDTSPVPSASRFSSAATPRSTDSNCISVCWLLRRFLTDSSGTYTEYKAVSIGAGCEGATDMLKDLYKPVREATACDR